MNTTWICCALLARRRVSALNSVAPLPLVRHTVDEHCDEKEEQLYARHTHSDSTTALLPLYSGWATALDRERADGGRQSRIKKIENNNKKERKKKEDDNRELLHSCSEPCRDRSALSQRSLPTVSLKTWTFNDHQTFGKSLLITIGIHQSIRPLIMGKKYYNYYYINVMASRLCVRVIVGCLNLTF